MPYYQARPETGPRVPDLERAAPFIAMVCFVLFSQGLESFIGREISMTLMGRMTLVMTFATSFVMCAMALRFRPRVFLFTLWVNLPFQLYSLIALASTAWSTSPSNTLKSSILLIAFHLIGTSMASMCSWRAIWKGLAMAILLLAFLSILVIPFGGIMDHTHPGAFRGLWLEKNATGEAFAVGAIACTIVSVADRNPLFGIGTLFLIGLLLLTGSAGALATSVLAICAFFFVEAIRRGPVRFFLGSWFAIIVIGAVVALLIGMGLNAAELLGRETNLTGRTQIWPTIVEFIQNRPMLGYGFQAFWVEGSATKTQVMHDANFEAFNAHNAYLEMMLAFGMFGSFFLWASILRAILQASSAVFGSNGARRYVLAFFVFALILSLTESMLGDAAGVTAFVLGVMVPKTALGFAQAKGRFRH